MRHHGRYLHIDFFGWLLWGDIVRVAGKVLMFFGLACRHPRASQVDYGMGCGICRARMTRHGFYPAIGRPIWAQRIAIAIERVKEEIQEILRFWDWGRR